MATFRLGWRPDLPDHRDYHYIAPMKGTLPPKVDLRPDCPPVYDQGQLGSCTANAVGSALDFQRKKQGEPFLSPSRLFIYYNTRLSEGTVESDAGATIRDTVKEIAKKGACPENEWPYQIDMFSTEPPELCYKDAVKYEALKYVRVSQDQLSLKTALADGHTIVCGISVYESFQHPQKGFVSVPGLSETLLGGHAQEYVGYEVIKGKLYYIGKNSWGTSWGLSGYYYMPSEYLENPNLARDFWILEKTK